ncbi:MAG: O-antigen ligase family protein [Chloroflexota bacterium]
MAIDVWRTAERSELSATWHIGSQRRRVAVLTVLAIAASLVSVLLVLALQIVSAVMLAIWLLVIGIAWRPRIGLYVAFGLILMFEAGSADRMMVPGEYLHSGLANTLGLPGVIFNPLELLLVLSFGIWLAQGIAQRRLDYRAGRLGWPMLLFFLALVFGLVRGAAGGGDLNIAFWEARALFYIIICYVLAANTIRTRRQVAILTTIGLLAMAFWAAEGAYRQLFLIDVGLLGETKEFYYSHEVVVFLGALLLLVLAQHVFGAPLWQRLFGLAIVPVGVFTLLATERRAGQIATMIAFLAFALVFLAVHRKAFFTIALPLLIGGAIYLPLFWNNTSMVGQPARAIRSLYQPDERDAASNLYRLLEKINVRATIKSDPLRGVGFGREFLFVVSLPDLSWWPFWHYMPHHNILWVWLKTGAFGFIIFWTLMGTAIAQAAYFARVLRQREARVFALLALAGIISSLVFCWVDLGLVMNRVTVFLGTILGTLAVLDQIE